MFQDPSFLAREQQLYQMEREKRFKVEDPAGGDPTYRELEDEGVKDELLKLAQVEHILQKFLGEIRTEQSEALKPLNEAMSEAMRARIDAEHTRNTAKEKADEAPEDEEAKEALRQAELVLESQKLAEEEAKENLNTATSAFDFKAAFETRAKEEGEDGALRKGASIVEVKGPKNRKYVNVVAASA